VAHLLHWGIVNEHVAFRTHLAAKFKHLLEIVGGVGHLRPRDAHVVHIAYNVFLEFRALLFWIGVIKAQNHPPTVLTSKVIIQECCFAVANVQEAAGLRREASHDVAMLGVGKLDISRLLTLFAALAGEGLLHVFDVL